MYTMFSRRTRLLVTGFGSEFDVYLITTALPPGRFASDTPLIVTALPCDWICFASFARPLAAVGAALAGVTATPTPSNLLTNDTSPPASVRAQPSGHSRSEP